MTVTLSIAIALSLAKLPTILASIGPTIGNTGNIVWQDQTNCIFYIIQLDMNFDYTTWTCPYFLSNKVNTPTTKKHVQVLLKTKYVAGTITAVSLLNENITTARLDAFIKTFCRWSSYTCYPDACKAKFADNFIMIFSLRGTFATICNLSGVENVWPATPSLQLFMNSNRTLNSAKIVGYYLGHATHVYCAIEDCPRAVHVAYERAMEVHAKCRWQCTGGIYCRQVDSPFEKFGAEVAIVRAANCTEALSAHFGSPFPRSRLLFTEGDFPAIGEMIRGPLSPPLVIMSSEKVTEELDLNPYLQPFDLSSWYAIGTFLIISSASIVIIIASSLSISFKTLMVTAVNSMLWSVCVIFGQVTRMSNRQTAQLKIVLFSVVVNSVFISAFYNCVLHAEFTVGKTGKLAINKIEDIQHRGMYLVFSKHDCAVVQKIREETSGHGLGYQGMKICGKMSRKLDECGFMVRLYLAHHQSQPKGKSPRELFNRLANLTSGMKFVCSEEVPTILRSVSEGGNKTFLTSKENFWEVWAVLGKVQTRDNTPMFGFVFDGRDSHFRYATGTWFFPSLKRNEKRIWRRFRALHDSSGLVAFWRKWEGMRAVRKNLRVQQHLEHEQKQPRALSMGNSWNVGVFYILLVGFGLSITALFGEIALTTLFGLQCCSHS